MTTPRARPPASLPRPARAMLAAYREAHALPVEAEDRIWSVVGKGDAPEPVFDPLAEPDLASRTDRRWTSYAGASLAAAAVLLLAWRMGGSIAERREAERTPSAAVMQGGGSPSQGHAITPSPRAATPKTREPSPTTAPAPTDDPPTIVAPTPIPEPVEPSEPPARPRPSSSSPAEPSSPSSTDPTPDPATPSTFAAERELVAQAWRALALGDHAQALQAAAEHTRRFPAGLLVPERAAIETIAHCRQDPTDGPRRASAFHRAHPRSPLAARVDEACEKKSTAP